MEEQSGDEQKKSLKVETSSLSAGVIILQWLTYAFWGWTILSLVWLMYIVFASMMTDLDTSTVVPYAIAAALVLLPISLVCDLFYGKYEPSKKVGAAMVVMVIHAVIFALFGIGMLISGVLSVVELSIASSGSNDRLVWIVTLFLSAVIYAVTFLRTLNPSEKLGLKKLYPVVMVAVVGVFIIAGFVGPVARASLTRDDRLIEKTIYSVTNAIRTKTTSDSRLPENLTTLSLTGDTKTAVDKGLFRYKPEGLVAGTNSGTSSSRMSEIQESLAVPDTTTGNTSRQYDTYRYQLCVTYKRADKNNSFSAYSDQYSLGESSDYTRTVNTSGHPAGEVCYKLEVRQY